MVNVRRTASIDFDRDRMGTPEAVRGTVVRFAAAGILLDCWFLLCCSRFCELRLRSVPICRHCYPAKMFYSAFQRRDPGLVRTETPQDVGSAADSLQEARA